MDEEHPLLLEEEKEEEEEEEEEEQRRRDEEDVPQRSVAMPSEQDPSLMFYFHVCSGCCRRFYA
jgi:hypothetical protein